jgi:hypothetical protein
LRTKEQLSEGDLGRYVVIDAHSGRWMTGNAVEVVFEICDAMPSSHPVGIKYPNISTMRLSSRNSKSFECKSASPAAPFRCAVLASGDVHTVGMHLLQGLKVCCEAVEGGEIEIRSFGRLV